MSMRYGAVLLTVLVSIAVYVIAGLALGNYAGGTRDLAAQNHATLLRVNDSVRRIDALVAAQQKAQADLAASRTQQLVALRNGLLDRCQRANRTYSALIRILRTTTRAIRREIRFKRRSALRTYKRAFIRLQPVDCEKAYPPIQP
jgi:hypothetical protein